jgi:hypothetical protein
MEPKEETKKKRVDPCEGCKCIYVEDCYECRWHVGYHEEPTEGSCEREYGNVDLDRSYDW